MVPEPARQPGLPPRALLAWLPLLATSRDAVTALGLGAANAIVLLVALPLLAILRPRLGESIRAPATAIVVASAVTALALALQACAPALHGTLAARLPLLALGALILAQDEASIGRGAGVALREAVRVSTAGGIALLLFGALREVLGHGTLFAGAGALLGLPGWESNLAPRGAWLVASLPAGGLLLLGGLLACWPRRAHGGEP